MKLADAYPQLNALARSHGTTLEELAARPHRTDDSLTLASCCWRVR